MVINEGKRRHDRCVVIQPPTRQETQQTQNICTMLNQRRRR